MNSKKPTLKQIVTFVPVLLTPLVATVPDICTIPGISTSRQAFAQDLPETSFSDLAYPPGIQLKKDDSPPQQIEVSPTESQTAVVIDESPASLGNIDASSETAHPTLESKIETAIEYSSPVETSDELQSSIDKTLNFSFTTSSSFVVQGEKPASAEIEGDIAQARTRIQSPAVDADEPKPMIVEEAKQSLEFYRQTLDAAKAKKDQVVIARACHQLTINPR